MSRSKKTVEAIGLIIGLLIIITFILAIACKSAEAGFVMIPPKDGCKQGRIVDSNDTGENNETNR